MRKVKEILRLKWEIGLAARQIAQSLLISHSTVLDMLRRAERAGLTWPLPDIDEATLEVQLYPGNPEATRKRPEPDMRHIHQELRRKGVTLQLLWGLLVDLEWAYRQNRRLAQLLKAAKLRLPANMEDIDYQQPRGLDRALMRTLAACQWVKGRQHILVIGPTGVGKTYIACALGNAACRRGHSTRYYRVRGSSATSRRPRPMVPTRG